MIGSIGMMPLNDRTLRTSHKNAANTPNTADASQLKTVSWSEVVNGTAPTASIVVPRDEEDRAAMNAYFADYFARNPGTHEEQPDLDETMTSGEWKALAEKYDPRSMTRAQYDAFLDDLREMGAINAEDLHPGPLGLSGDGETHGGKRLQLHHPQLGGPARRRLRAQV